MEAFNTSIFKKSKISSGISPFRHNFYIPNQAKRSPSRKYGTHPSLPFSSSSLFPNGRNLRILAHFGRPSKRRNSLRKKLIEEQKLRLHTDSIDSGSNYQYPIYISDEIEPFESNPSLGNLEEIVEKPKLSNDSVLWRKFENWVDQYKKDAEFWGVGSGPVFNVSQDTDGNVEHVFVNEDEILRRSQIEPSLFKQEGHGGNFVEVNSKISYAKCLAREIEKGEYKLPRNSSIAKFVVSGQEPGFVNGLRSVLLRPNVISKLPRIGFAMICSFFVFWLVKEAFMAKNNGVELTREQKEMLRRKMKLRMEREKLESGSVEVLPNVANPLMGSTARPELNKEELMNSISKAKAAGEELMLPHSSSSFNDETRNFNDKILEIKEMARQALELERKNREEHEDVKEEFSSDMEDSKVHEELGVRQFHDLSDGGSAKPIDTNATRELPSVDKPLQMNNGSFLEGASRHASENSDSQVSGLSLIVQSSGNGRKSQQDPNRRESMDTKGGIQSCPTSEPLFVDDPPTEDIELFLEGASAHASENSDSQIPGSASTVVGSENGMESQWDQNKRESSTLPLLDTKEEVQSPAVRNEETYDSTKSSTKMKPKIMLTVKEAREYLSRKHDRAELDKEPKIKSIRLCADVVEPSTDEEVHVQASQMIPNETELHLFSSFDKTSKTKSVMSACGYSAQTKTDSDVDALQSVLPKTDDSNDMEKTYEMGDFQRPRTSEEHSDIDCNREAAPVISKESWMEKNFQEFEPVIKKIGDGFRENYAVAKEKVQEELNLGSEIGLPGYDEDDGELEWMKDDSLREIVFQVRENELMGRDPFHMMDAKDKQAFFKGLEEKVEKESGKLLNLHKWIHSRIENLDYGADGISLYDSPEKVIPRWKGPTLNKDPEFLNKAVNRRKGFFSENTGVSNPVNQNLHDTLQKSTDTPASGDVPSSSGFHISSKTPESDASKNPKTVIESSDGSSRAGKKSGKEYWQHTKKWSREFLDLYNAETDPEVKSIMKDMGKDLNRWITEKEIQETDDLTTKIPKRKRRYIEKKLEKLKREMEIFGPQAVVSKYREYAEEEEDYLWWLDLPFVLCIELYTNEDGADKVGFYSLVMAEDLELDPKQYHVISFEDPGDSKSFCYIIQAHLEMLGRGSAFVVARPPKDAFREAKANGFGVTVMRKGELQLNVDQTLEEVEEQITEIGSKVYHDKIIHERSVDMGSLMKGVFGNSKPAKRGRSKRKLKKLPGTEH